MATQHRPDFLAFPRENMEKRARETKFREAFVWPQVNQEDLIYSKTLLLFMNARGRHLPEGFACADLRSVDLGLQQGAIRPCFLNGYTMMLRGQTSAESYGKLIAWDEDDRAREWARSGAQMKVGNGLLVLEIQQRILKFLVNCCRSILHEMSDALLRGPDVPVQIEPLPLTLDPGSRPSLATIIAETPYKAPAELNLTRLQDIISQARGAADDHILMLREDPGFFLEQMKLIAEHQAGHLACADKFKKTDCNSPKFWDAVLRQMCLSAYGRLFHFSQIQGELQKLKRLKARNPGPFTWDSKIPDAYSKALHRLRQLLNRACAWQFGLLRRSVPASPPMRARFERYIKPRDPGVTCECHRCLLEEEIEGPFSYTSGESCGCSSCWHVQSKMHIANSEVLWIFTILSDEKKRDDFRLSDLMDELDRRMRKAKELVTPLVATYVSDLSVFAECLRQLSLFHPWSATADRAPKDFCKALVDELHAESSATTDFMFQLDRVSLFRDQPALDALFAYPVEKRRTRVTVDRMRAAEWNLDSLWADFEDLFKDDVQAIIQLMSPCFCCELQRTPPWAGPVETEKPAPPPPPPAKLETTTYELLQHQRSTAAEPLREISINARALSTPKVRVKTRAPSHSPHAHSKPIAPKTSSPLSTKSSPPPTTTAPPKIKVSKRALKAFAFLFPTPAGGAPGELPWTEFLAAMASAGFTTEKMHGSAWLFAPTEYARRCGGRRGGLEEEAVRNIQFHEPHPLAKIWFWYGRRIGRRLERAYGWSLETFEGHD